MKVINTEKKPIKIWSENIESSALSQAINLANLPFTYKHIALMPDVHMGYGMPIGGVLATKGVVIPNAVGVDIGCGMCAIRTSLNSITDDQLKAIRELIHKRVPVGFKRHKESQDSDLMPSMDILDLDIVDANWENALTSLGTLGGGNHFIEIQRDTKTGNIWIMIHSGSRNLGKQVADHYNKLAKKLNEKWFSIVDPKDDLAFLPMQTIEAHNYMNEMQFCVDYALANRELMMTRIKKSFEDVVSGIEFYDTINVAHNYARLENHFGQNVVVHRKGATSAKEGELGIIPGSQGTCSYIVKGRGNKDSFESCSHGAGRAMGRKQAQRELDLETEIKRLDDRGIIHSVRNVSDLDEATGAYKDINVVMENQKDLTEIVVELTPLAVIKG